MKFNLKLKAVGAVVAALVAGALPTAANADAIAQSILNITNFTFRVGNNAAGIGGALPGTVNISATTTAEPMVSSSAGSLNSRNASTREGTVIPASPSPSANSSPASNGAMKCITTPPPATAAALAPPPHRPP